MGKNLEAQDEVYKGIIRTPLAFLFGGPVGVVVNSIYTAAKVKSEIDREEEHKKYLRSIGINQNPDIFKEGKEKLLIEEKIRSSEKEAELDYLKDEFNNADDYSYNDGCRIEYRCKESLTHVDKKYAAIIHIGYGVKDSFGGYYLPEKDFIEKYKKDMVNTAIQKKYKFYNNKVRGTFGYKTKDGFWFTGMFTIIE